MTLCLMAWKAPLLCEDPNRINTVGTTALPPTHTDLSLSRYISEPRVSHKTNSWICMNAVRAILFWFVFLSRRTIPVACYLGRSYWSSRPRCHHWYHHCLDAPPASGQEASRLVIVLFKSILRNKNSLNIQVVPIMKIIFMLFILNNLLYNVFFIMYL